MRTLPPIELPRTVEEADAVADLLTSGRVRSTAEPIRETAMPTRDRVVEWAEAYRVAWETADADAAAALFTEDSSYRSEIYEEPHRGRSGVVEYWTGVTSSQSDASVTMGAPFVDGDRVAVEFWTRMKVDGSPVTLAGCLLLRFADDGRCSDLREYWHFTEGDHEPPEGWGT